VGAKIGGDILARRYVYWRTPEGKPYKRDDGKHAPTALLAEIGSTAKVDDKGQIRWEGVGLALPDFAVCSAIIVLDPDDAELNNADAWRIAWAAIISVIKELGGGKPVPPHAVIMEADKHAAEYYRKPSARLLPFFRLLRCAAEVVQQGEA
jgi:hypothetical protein